jgi:abortive infection bacteriophage resistance protein
VPETDPTVDEMLAAIEARIKDDVKSIMDHALAHEDNLAYLYKCAKRGRLVRPCW